jgi:predicted metalloprotease with PDZ domain
VLARLGSRPAILCRAALVALATVLVADTGRADTIDVDIDATDLPRKLLSATLTIPVPPSARTGDGVVALWYPKWVPGVHAPGGPVQNVAGLVFETTGGEPLDWVREPGEVYRVNVRTGGADPIVARMRYIADQPSTNSDGIDSYGSDEIGFVSPNTVLLVPHGTSITEMTVDATITLPPGWTLATALRAPDGGPPHAASSPDPPPTPGAPPSTGATFAFERVTLETYVDSPILCGRYIERYELVEDVVADRSPPQTMHVVSESKQATDIDETLLARFRRMTTEATLLFESHPFARYDLLVAVSDILKHNGLEHLSSSYNAMSQRALEDVESLKGWERYLIPHEYTHAWCGKYRRPAGMLTTDFHAPKDTELLWVYEGLDQYLGKVLEVRSGFAPPEAFTWYVREQIRDAMYTQGRAWRPLDDTAASAHVLRDWSRSWGLLRRGQDFYHEGALMWLEADARIRNLTDGERSLDDFCRLFFARTDGDPVPNPHTREDVVRLLGEVAEGDWDTFVRERVEEPGERYRLDLLSEIGYRVQYSNEAPDPPESEGGGNGVSAFESIGASFWGDGTVGHVILDTPADEAGLAPGMTILGVGGYTWSADRLRDAIAESAETGAIELLIESGDRYETRTIHYDGGPRHLVLVRDDEAPDRLSEIATPLDPRPLPAADEAE